MDHEGGGVGAGSARHIRAVNDAPARFGVEGPHQTNARHHPSLQATQRRHRSRRRTATVARRRYSRAVTIRPEFLLDAPPELQDFFHDIAVELILAFDMSHAEAVARINCQWRGHKFARHGDLLPHAPPRHWAQLIYFQEIFEDNRLQRIPRPPPARDSGCWTIF